VAVLHEQAAAECKTSLILDSNGRVGKGELAGMLLPLSCIFSTAVLMAGR